MGTSRWDPVNDLVSLREAMNGLLEESFVRPGRGPAVAAGPAGLALDVRETPEAFSVTASVPGVAAEDVDITVLGDTLRIRGERKDEAEQQDEQGRWLIRERRFGAFERTVTLPATLRSDAAEATFEDGILTISLPKADEAKPRSIPVRGKAATAGDRPMEIEVQATGETGV